MWAVWRTAGALIISYSRWQPLPEMKWPVWKKSRAQVGDAPSISLDIPAPESYTRRPSDSQAGTSLPSTSTSSSTPSHYEPGSQVLLRLEYLSDKEAKCLIVALRLTVLIALGSLIYLTVANLTMDSNYFFRNDILQIWNASAAAIFLAAILVSLGRYLWHMWVAKRAGKQWTKRRWRLACLCLCELNVQLINLVVYLLPNVYTLAHGCGWYDPLIRACGLIRWTCWNTLFFIAVVYAHDHVPLAHHSVHAKSTDARADAVQHPLVVDAKWRYHARKLPLWFAVEGVLVGYGVWLFGPVNPRGTYGRPCLVSQGYDTSRHRCHVISMPPGTEHNCRLWVYSCNARTQARFFTCFLAGLILLYFVLYSFYIFKALRQLSEAPYVEFRFQNIAIRVQLQIRMMAYGFTMLSFVLLWFIDLSSCSSYLVIWLGMFPMQLPMTVMFICVAFLATPKTPREDPSLLVWLQEYAMTEAEKPAKMARRGLPGEPMFCFETALKLQHWAALVYYYHEGVLGGKRTPELALGMQLCQLEHLQVVWEKRGDTNVLIAWGADTVVIAFRGTASLANVLADLKMWRANHPAVQGQVCLGTQPLVHTGFLASWQANGLDQRVLQQMRSILSERKASATPLKVYMTGHSLGGALATLAAFDIQQQLQGQHHLQVCCYAYGAPRTGNHAFARLYNKAVPDTWHVINGQDAVAQEGKFLVLYKRPGHRVIINQRGDLIVRPTLVEHSVRRVPGGSSVNQHLLRAYRKSLLAVINAQFTQKGGRSGQQGVLKLADCPHMRQLLEQTLGVDLVRLASVKPRTSPILPEEDAGANGAMSPQVPDAQFADTAVDAESSSEQLMPSDHQFPGLDAVGGSRQGQEPSGQQSEGPGIAAVLKEFLFDSLADGLSHADKHMAEAAALECAAASQSALSEGGSSASMSSAPHDDEPALELRQPDEEHAVGSNPDLQIQTLKDLPDIGLQ
ncbi:hypothetical protein WJX72_003574 [[Myrmecia] bisecta]|uniref:Fungal lipase-type domain-containing protein n=1 Tax=[Myrmecia] bisecta TaxID=41462 RepID=A0AAW1QBE8_9CHLO